MENDENRVTVVASGDMDRLRRFWLTGVCKPNKAERQFSEPLATEQFLSAFLLLLAGIGLAVMLLTMEHLYFRYVRRHLSGTKMGACCSLVSIVTRPKSHSLDIGTRKARLAIGPAHFIRRIRTVRTLNGLLEPTLWQPREPGKTAIKRFWRARPKTRIMGSSPDSDGFSISRRPNFL